MKKFKFYLVVLVVLLGGYFAINIYNGVANLFMGKRGEQATSLTKTGQGSATTIVDNKNSGDGTNSFSGTARIGSFSEDKVKESMAPVLDSIFKHSVESQNKLHLEQDSSDEVKSFDSKIVSDDVFARIIKDISVETGKEETLKINGMETKISDSDSVYKFGKVSLVSVAQQGEFAQLTGTFAYSVDGKGYNKEFSAFTDSSYKKITEINLQ